MSHRVYASFPWIYLKIFKHIDMWYKPSQRSFETSKPSISFPSRPPSHQCFRCLPLGFQLRPAPRCVASLAFAVPGRVTSWFSLKLWVLEILKAGGFRMTGFRMLWKALGFLRFGWLLGFGMVWGLGLSLAYCSCNHCLVDPAICCRSMCCATNWGNCPTLSPHTNHKWPLSVIFNFLEYLFNFNHPSHIYKLCSSSDSFLNASTPFACITYCTILCSHWTLAYPLVIKIKNKKDCSSKVKPLATPSLAKKTEGLRSLHFQRRFSVSTWSAWSNASAFRSSSASRSPASSCLQKPCSMGFFRDGFGSKRIPLLKTTAFLHLPNWGAF